MFTRPLLFGAPPDCGKYVFRAGRIPGILFFGGSKRQVTFSRNPSNEELRKSNVVQCEFSPCEGNHLLSRSESGNTTYWTFGVNQEHNYKAIFLTVVWFRSKGKDIFWRTVQNTMNNVITTKSYLPTYDGMYKRMIGSHLRGSVNQVGETSMERIRAQIRFCSPNKVDHECRFCSIPSGRCGYESPRVVNQ